MQETEKYIITIVFDSFFDLRSFFSLLTKEGLEVDRRIKPLFRKLMFTESKKANLLAKLSMNYDSSDSTYSEPVLSHSLSRDRLNQNESKIISIGILFQDFN
jgi:hypothetical protein